MSCPAVTVTVCSSFHFAVVKLRLVLSSPTSVPACPLIVTVTVSEGSVASATV